MLIFPVPLSKYLSLHLVLIFFRTNITSTFYYLYSLLDSWLYCHLWGSTRVCSGLWPSVKICDPTTQLHSQAEPNGPVCSPSLSLLHFQMISTSHPDFSPLYCTSLYFTFFTSIYLSISHPALVPPIFLSVPLDFPQTSFGLAFHLYLPCVRICDPTTQSRSRVELEDPICSPYLFLLRFWPVSASLPNLSLRTIYHLISPSSLPFTCWFVTFHLFPRSFPQYACVTRTPFGLVCFILIFSVPLE